MLRQQGRKHRAVYVPYLPGAGFLVGGDKLVTRGDHSNTKARTNRNFPFPDGSQRADILRRQHAARLENSLAGEHVVPAEDQVHAGGTGLENADSAVAVVLRILNHHNAVASLRDCSARGHIGTGILLNRHART